jgi:vesicle transport through interaction with t-SNAREs protein 1
MSSLTQFSQYDEEFTEISEQAKTAINRLSRDIESLEPSSELDSEIRHITNLVNQCEDLLKQMTIEAREADDAALKKSHQNQVRVCKTNLDNLKADFKNLKNETDRSTLMSGGKDTTRLSNDAKARLLSTNDAFSRQNETLENAKRTIAETEETALDITSELGKQREKIEGIHGRVREVSGMTNTARRILNSMSRREVKQKIAVYVIVAVIVIVFLVIIFT